MIKTRWSVDDGATWTLSNRQTLPLPETIWAGWMFKRMAHDGLPEPPAVTTLRDVRRAEVNRLSIGMQSADTGELRLFARRHDVDDVRRTMALARRAGFANLNLDLIYGVPGQSMATWQHSLNVALIMNPDHLSLYSLGIEDGTPMQRWIEQGAVPAPDPDLAADMIEWATEHLAAQGFTQYEISNWSRPGFESRHNLHYWRNLPYLGLGAGAHGYAARTRYSTALRPADYIARIEAQRAPLAYPLSAAAVDSESIDDQLVRREAEQVARTALTPQSYRSEKQQLLAQIMRQRGVTKNEAQDVVLPMIREARGEEEGGSTATGSAVGLPEAIDVHPLRRFVDILHVRSAAEADLPTSISPP